MKAWLLDQLTGIESLRLDEIADPSPGQNEVLLRVLFAGLNPADRYLAQKEYPAKPAFPHILGRDAIGVVEAVGEGVTQFAPGDKAIILRSEIGVNRAGTFAEKVVVPAESLATPPRGWTDEQAGGATLVYLTAWQAISIWGDVPDRAVVLVTGASGGVGVAAVQLANALGYRVVALSRSAEKREQLAGLGATIAIDASAPDWAKQVRAFCEGQNRRVDLAIDNVGGAAFNGILETLANRGRVSCVGRLAGPVPQFNTASLFFRQLRIGGIAVGSYTPSESRAAWQSLQAALSRTGAKPLVDEVFAFEELQQAFERLQAGPMGKVLVRVGAS